MVGSLIKKYLMEYFRTCKTLNELRKQRDDGMEWAERAANIDQLTARGELLERVVVDLHDLEQG